MRALIRLCLMAALAGAPYASHAAGPPLRLCADPSNLPFSSNAPDAAAKGMPGLYVEIGREIAQALGRELTVSWSLSYFGKANLRSTLLAGQCDFAVGLPAESDFMGKRIVLSRPILKLGYALVVPRTQGTIGIDDLVGKRVAVQFATPPQSLLATRDDIRAVTVMSPEEGMRRLADGEADAAFIWGANAGWVNHTALNEAYSVAPVPLPHMQWEAAVGFAAKHNVLRDQVDGVLGRLEPRIRELAARYAVPTSTPIDAVSGSTPLAARNPFATRAVVVTIAPGALHRVADDVKTAAGSPMPEGGDAKSGHEVFNATCAHCHGPDAVVADRKINLRRLKAKYGAEMADVFFTTVTNGRPTKGMPAWKDVYKQEDLVNILTYLKTVQED